MWFDRQIQLNENAYSRDNQDMGYIFHTKHESNRNKLESTRRKKV